MYMEVTPEQRSILLNQKRTSNHMFRWVYDVLHSEVISEKQYQVLIQIMDMTVGDQSGYIIHQDSLWPVPTRVKKYQKTTSGWKQTTKWADPANRPKTYQKRQK